MFEKIKAAILDGDVEETAALVKKALADGLEPLEVLNKGCIPGIEKAGALFEAEEFFLPELITAGEATKAAMELLLPELRKKEDAWQSAGKFVIGTVEGDMHDIGKSIVASMLSAAGFEVFDLGIDVSAERFIEEIKTKEPDFLGLSALLTSTMPKQQEVIDALKEAGLRDKVKVFVGGAPVSSEWAEKIGADGYAEDAVAAVKLAKKSKE
ncbi:MAG TPA: corrinoid protein [Bacillota bacterium]|nr:corrinoid protein [Bacillota bacterium]HOJ85036.1 corrinoid protein [Bacillota bacterium]HPZ11817.1 corrinoid protein [Bacillota bacterium]HQE09595.1 corrinoid protein [Bacillota bacterium]